GFFATFLAGALRVAGFFVAVAIPHYSIEIARDGPFIVRRIRPEGRGLSSFGTAHTSSPPSWIEPDVSAVTSLPTPPGNENYRNNLRSPASSSLTSGWSSLYVLSSQVFATSAAPPWRRSPLSEQASLNVPGLQRGRASREVDLADPAR
ncbi:MAG: hypothetical protein WC809_21560, partial [Sinimarinibacterium sp.]